MKPGFIGLTKMLSQRQFNPARTILPLPVPHILTFLSKISQINIKNTHSVQVKRDSKIWECKKIFKILSNPSFCSPKNQESKGKTVFENLKFLLDFLGNKKDAVRNFFTILFCVEKRCLFLARTELFCRPRSRSNEFDLFTNRHRYRLC